MSTYTVEVTNNSQTPTTFVLYQGGIESSVPGVSLAWMTVPLLPQHSAALSWTIDYSFVWSTTGELMPGLVFTPQQAIFADPSRRNTIPFTNNGGFLGFGDPSETGQPGSLSITCGNGVPPGTAAVGVGMSGNGTFVVNAEANIGIVFTPHPSYWLTFGTFIQGEVLDTARLSNAAEIIFPANTYRIKATLMPDGTFAIESA